MTTCIARDFGVLGLPLKHHGIVCLLIGLSTLRLNLRKGLQRTLSRGRHGQPPDDLHHGLILHGDVKAFVGEEGGVRQHVQCCNGPLGILFHRVVDDQRSNIHGRQVVGVQRFLVQLIEDICGELLR
eukprot:Skav234835  [mRNA]  locus=scaffold1428:21631:33273:+ [translate_table: standard]